MRMIEIAPLDNGAHRNQTSSEPVPLPEGWAVVPDDLETPNFPFGEVTVEDADGTPTVSSWTPLPIPEPEPVPTEEQTYTADDMFQALLGAD